MHRKPLFYFDLCHLTQKILQRGTKVEVMFAWNTKTMLSLQLIAMRFFLHFLITFFSIFTYRNLSVVKFIPWKLHKTWLP